MQENDWIQGLRDMQFFNTSDLSYFLIYAHLSWYLMIQENNHLTFRERGMFFFISCCYIL
jgi:hypothetical protein